MGNFFFTKHLEVTYSATEECHNILCCENSQESILDSDQIYISGQDKNLNTGVIHKDLARAVIPPITIASLSAILLSICTLMQTTAAVWAGCFLVELTRAFLYVTMGTYILLT